MSNTLRRLTSICLLLALLLGACTPPAQSPTQTPAASPTTPPTGAPTSPPTPAPATPLPTVPAMPGGLLFVIEQTGGIAGFCDRLEVLAGGTLNYTSACTGVTAQGQAPAGVLAQLQDIAARLAPVSHTSEDNPGGPDNMMTAIMLSGTGTAEATDADITGLVQVGQILLAQMRDQVRATPVPTVPSTTPADGPEAIWVREASYANGSVHVAGEANPTFEQNLVVRVLSEDGQELVVQPTTIAAEAGQRGSFSADVAVPGAPATIGYVQVFHTSARDGGILHLVAVDLLRGTPAVLPQNREAIVIISPTLNTTLSGTVTVTGIADPTFEQTLLVQVYGPDGDVIGQAPGQINADVGQRGPFSIQVPITVAAGGPGRVTVSDASARDGSLLHVASVEILLAQ